MKKKAAINSIKSKYNLIFIIIKTNFQKTTKNLFKLYKYIKDTI